MNIGVVSRLIPVVLLSVLAGGCSLAAGIFKAGFWVGAVAVIAVVLVLVFVVGKFRS